TEYLPIERDTLMRKSIPHALLLLVSATSLLAGATITLSPADGGIAGLPGETTGWGFDMTADSINWISVTGSFLLSETDPGLGTYADLIGFQGGPVNFVLAPNS